ncbi:MAG: phosphohistidine phosphatase SixA [SAR324 cluster bacterium]
MSMRLYLMRHGSAEERNASGADAQRALTARGRARVEAVARGLAALGVEPKEVWSSPLLRARQTAEIVAHRLGVPAKRIHLTQSLVPEAAPRRFLAELAEMAKRGRGQGDDVLCCGHAPHLDDLLAECLGLGAQPRTALKKAGVACLEMALPPKEAARLEWLLPPAALRRMR